MLQSISISGRKISEYDIITLESMLVQKIPQDYERFLFMYNGGEPKPNCHDVQNTLGTNIGSFIGIRWFYWIDGPEKEDQETQETYSLKWNYSTYKNRIPKNFLPIGSDDGGNQICLSLYGEDKGSIWYWDHEAETTPPNYSNCYKVAESFQDLLNGLFEYDFENDTRIS